MHRNSGDDIPEGQDFVYCAPTPQDLDLPEPTLNDAADLLAEVPFIRAMRMLSVLAGTVYFARTKKSSQGRLAEMLYSELPKLRDKVLAFLDGRNRLAFDPRHITVLQRFVVLHGANRDEEWTREHHQRLVGALLAIAGALPHGEPADAPAGAETSMEEWTRYLAQVGMYYETPWIADAMARSWARYVTVAADLVGCPGACPIDDWMREDYGFTLAEQLAVGLAYGQGTGAFEATLSIEERGGRRARPGCLEDTALAVRESEAVSLISADRSELRHLLEAENPDPMHLGWDHAVFEARPFLRDDDGWLLLHSPAALTSWMTRGVHYRVLDAANRRLDGSGRRLGRRWLDYAGALGEESVRRLLKATYPHDSPAGRLHGEIEFRGLGGRQDSPDAALESFPDLALFEVYSGRFSRDAKSGDAKALLAAVRRATATKITEVLDRAGDVLEGRLVYPGAVEPPTVVWPLLVLAGDTISPTPMFWRWLRDELNGRIDSDPRVRTPLVIDLDDLEPVFALVEQGHRLFDLLDSYLRSDLREFPLRNWVSREFDLGDPHRPRYARQQWREAAKAGGQVLYPDSEKLHRAIDEDE